MGGGSGAFAGLSLKPVPLEEVCESQQTCLPLLLLCFPWASPPPPTPVIPAPPTPKRPLHVPGTWLASAQPPKQPDHQGRVWAQRASPGG